MTKPIMSVKTRFAPSPTGYLHIGGARTALYSWLYAKKTDGKFVLRIEDTDRERSTDESVQAIIDGMQWLGLREDEGPHYQTQRFDRYKAIIQQLLDSGHAYYCYCSQERVDALREQQKAAKQKPRYDGLCRDRQDIPEGVQPVVRFKNSLDGQVVIKDLIKGTVIIDNSELDDLIIARSDGTPTYNLTVVVDDMDMGMTHVIRGDDHLNNTPRQINILNALGAEPPLYAHVPMILGDDGKRLSKRHGAVSVMQYEADGYLPEALLNYLIRLGWSYGDQEVFSIDEMIALFTLEAVNKAASAFNTEKLLWLNQHYIKNMPAAELGERLQPYLQRIGVREDEIKQGPPLAAVADALRERAKTLVELAASSLMFYQEFDGYDEKAAKKNFKPDTAKPLTVLKEKFAALTDWQPEPLHQIVQQTAEELELKMGKVGQPLRVALAGTGMSPAIDVTLMLVGRERSLARIDKALAYIAELS